jgi:thiosulfate dehydrogenase
MKSLLVTLGLALAAAIGLGAGYLLWDTPKNWYAANVNKLGPGAENDLIRYGRDLIVDTARHIGVNAENPAMRYAGNDLACQSCHLNAGLQPFAAPFVSTFATFPMLVDNQVLTLHDRINGCMTRSMNGKALPDESREIAHRLYTFRRQRESRGRARCRHGPQAVAHSDRAARRAARGAGLREVLR